MQKVAENKNTKGPGDFSKKRSGGKAGREARLQTPEMSGHRENAGQTQRQHTWNLKGATHAQKWEHSRKATDVNKTSFFSLNLGDTAHF